MGTEIYMRTNSRGKKVYRRGQSAEAAQLISFAGEEEMEKEKLRHCGVMRETL